MEIINKPVEGNQEYIKLMKSETLKGIKYNWDFKILTNDVQQAVDLNNKLLKEFGREDNGE
jgi:hypothetical protein